MLGLIHSMVSDSRIINIFIINSAISICRLQNSCAKLNARQTTDWPVWNERHAIRKYNDLITKALAFNDYGIFHEKSKDPHPAPACRDIRGNIQICTKLAEFAFWKFVSVAHFQTNDCDRKLNKMHVRKSHILYVHIALGTGEGG